MVRRDGNDGQLWSLMEQPWASISRHIFIILNWCMSFFPPWHFSTIKTHVNANVRAAAIHPSIFYGALHLHGINGAIHSWRRWKRFALTSIRLRPWKRTVVLDEFRDWFYQRTNEIYIPDPLHHPPSLRELIRQQTAIGWRQVFNGRFSAQWGVIQEGNHYWTQADSKWLFLKIHWCHMANHADYSTNWEQWCGNSETRVYMGNMWKRR